MLKNKALALPFIVGLAIVGGVAASYAGLASAETATSTTSSGTTQTMTHKRPGVFGTVSAVSGTTLTVTSKNPRETTTTTYTVDVSAATIKKGTANAAPVTATVSDIAVGDTVAIRGTVSGTTVTATEVMDGMMPHGGFGGHGKGHGVMGTVSAVSGNTITIAGKDGASYTIDATSAKVSKTSTVSVSDITVGDTIGVQGTVSGTSVAATHIMDGVPAGPGM